MRNPYPVLFAAILIESCHHAAIQFNLQLSITNPLVLLIALLSTTKLPLQEKSLIPATELFLATLSATM